MQIFISMLVVSMMMFKYSTDSKSVSSKSTERRNFVMKEAGLCPDTPAVVDVEYLRIFSEGSSIFAKARANLTRDIQGFKKIVIEIRKCSDAANSEECELFQSLLLGNASCAIMEEKHALWSSIFKNVHPALHCPVKKGTYTMKRARMDTNTSETPLAGHAWEKYYWRYRIEAYEPAGMVLCFAFAGAFHSVLY